MHMLQVSCCLGHFDGGELSCDNIWLINCVVDFLLPRPCLRRRRFRNNGCQNNKANSPLRINSHISSLPRGVVKQGRWWEGFLWGLRRLVTVCCYGIIVANRCADSRLPKPFSTAADGPMVVSTLQKRWLCHSARRV